MRSRITLFGRPLKNAVFVASGTFAYGREFARFYDLSLLGGIMTKGTSYDPWSGNPLPRIAETGAGMLNAIGLENPGVEAVAERYLPFLRDQDTAIVVNIIGKTVEEYAAVAARLDREEGLFALEINVSCPNIKEGGQSFGRDPDSLFEVVAAVRERTGLPLIVKLSPNVSSPIPLALKAVEAGADALSITNTLQGMAIDLKTRRPLLANKVGGLSGPAIKPVALRLVWEVSQLVPVPVIGMGGIMTGEDAAEFVMAGADAVAVGTANLVDPWAAPRVIRELEAFLEREGIAQLHEIKGAAW